MRSGSEARSFTCHDNFTVDSVPMTGMTLSRCHADAYGFAFLQLVVSYSGNFSAL
jgi:hypothetical protein